MDKRVYTDHVWAKSLAATVDGLREMDVNFSDAYDEVAEHSGTSYYTVVEAYRNFGKEER